MFIYQCCCCWLKNLTCNCKTDTMIVTTCCVTVLNWISNLREMFEANYLWPVRSHCTQPKKQQVKKIWVSANFADRLMEINVMLDVWSLGSFEKLDHQKQQKWILIPRVDKLRQIQLNIILKHPWLSWFHITDNQPTSTVRFDGRDTASVVQ